MNTRITGALLAASIVTGLAGCASTGSVPDGQSPLKDALAREVTLDNTFAVSDADGFFSATVPGASMPTVTPQEGFYQVSIPIGSEIAMECFVYEDALDSAATLQALLTRLLADFPRKGILQIDAGSFDRQPYVSQEMVYVTDQGAAGVLKGIVAPVGMSTLACLHDEPGYREAFRHVAGAFAASLKVHDAEPENWKFREILVWRLGDTKVGYTMNSIGETGDGDFQSVIETAVVIPRTAEETLTHDGYDVIYENAQGEVIAGRYAEATSGELTLSIDLEQGAGGGYRVSGLFQGKEVEGPLNTNTIPVGPYRQLTELIRAARPRDGQPQPLSIETYVPSVSPLQTVAVEAQPTGQQVDGLPEYAMLFGGMKATSLVDDHGQQAVTLQMGSLELQLSRAYLDGNI